MTPVHASVIIPTHNRCDSVLRAVSALMKQDFTLGAYEVLVSCDRCTDGTEETLQSSFQNRVQVLRSAIPGEAAAWNTGVRHAKGDLIILVDDDMEPHQGFVSAHVLAHSANPDKRIAITGYSPAILDEHATPLMRQQAKAYEAFFEDLEKANRPNTPLDLLSGNCSIPASAIREVGGFNESYVFARDDFEFAVRLLDRGYEFRLCRAARANMHMQVSADTMINRAVERAKHDYRLSREHPLCVPHLPFYRPLRDISARRRWRVLWETSRIAAAIFRAARTIAPDNLHLVNWEYAARYCLALRHEVGTWKDFCRLYDQDVKNNLVPFLPPVA